MPPLPSPRVPGVLVLHPEATGPEYARWKRAIKSAFVTKKTWGHCDGSCPMPMPEAGPNFFSPTSPTNPQPKLLDDRRAWVKKDREVKLDIFLSVADDIKIEIFEVGPPLPPAALTAQEMLAALDERFEAYSFEEYHHVFCHFLNLHIDQYTNIEDFNEEFQATLEDLLDHGHPMSNAQACSAYFSKLRCTQNPWVAAKIQEWDAQKSEPQLAELMKESPPWSIIRPLTMSSKPTSQGSIPESVPEESLEDTPGHSDGEDTPSESEEVATVSSKSSHSRQSSRSTQKSQEIIVHASYEDLTELQAFPNVPAAILPPTTIPKRASSIAKFAPLQPLPPMNRPLPPIPPVAVVSKRARSASPVQTKTPKPATASKLSLDLPSTSKSKPQMTLEQIHPALRGTASRTTTPEPTTAIKDADTHPALRTPSPTQNLAPPTKLPTLTAPAGHIAAVMRPLTPNPQPTQSNLLPPNIHRLSLHGAASTPDLHQRLLDTTRAVINPQPSMDNLTSPQKTALTRMESNNSSIISLPLQGTTEPKASPEFMDATITEGAVSTTSPSPSPPPQLKPRAMSKMEMARLRFENLSSSPPRGTSEDEKRNRKRSWSIKARLSARHGIKEII